MLLIVMLVCLIVITLAMIRRDDKVNRPDHYAAKWARRKARRARRRARKGNGTTWDLERSRANLDAIYRATRDLPDETIRDLSATMLGGLAGFVPSATWERALSRVPVPCRTRVAVRGKTVRCRLEAGHDGPHRLT